MSNYFAVGIRLVEHLQSKKSGLGVNFVGTAADIGKINKQITPALYVVNTANNPADVNGAVDSRDLQQWTIVVAVSNQSAQTDTLPLMQQAGDLISAVINEVQGFEIDDYHDPLQRTNTSGRPEYFSSFALYPLTFQTKITP